MDRVRTAPGTLLPGLRLLPWAGVASANPASLDSLRSPGWVRLRRILLPAVLPLLLTLLTGHSGLSAADWPQFLGPDRNGSSPETDLARTFPKDGPTVLWQRGVGQGFSGPVVSQDRVFLFHRLGDQETLEAMDARDGQVLWKSSHPTGYQDDFGFDEGPRGTPAVAGERIYTHGADGRLTCWRTDTGAQAWSVDTHQDFGSGKGFFGRACSPLVEGESVILTVGGRSGAGVVAFQRETGKVLWTATGEEASYASPVAAGAPSARRLLILSRAGLHVLDPKDGRLLLAHPWRPPVSASVSAATPLVIDDQIFLSASYGLGALLLRQTGGALEKVWEGDGMLSNHYATSVHHRGFLYGFDGRQEQGCELRCVELKTGRVRWKQEGLKAGTVTLAGGQLLVLTERGELLLAPARPEEFKPTARAQALPFMVRAHPALAHGRLYARSKDKLVCVNLAAAARAEKAKDAAP